MDSIQNKVKKMLELMGLESPSVEFDEVGKKLNITVDEGEWFKKHLPDLVKELKHLVSLMTRKDGGEMIHVDINNYRKEREKLIVELAKAAAQKAVISKGDVHLPAMNAYERRLVHMELSMRPDVKTESIGEGKERGVIIKPV